MTSGQTTSEFRESAVRIPDRIVEAAAKMMERDGFDGSSMREIAAAAGVSKPGLYYHAPSKEFLLFAIHDRFATQLIDRAEEVLTADLLAGEKLRELIRLNVGTIARFKSEATVFLREYWHLTDELRTIIDTQRDRYRVIYEEVLREGVEAGEFLAGDVHLDALAVLGTCNFAGVWFDPDGAWSADQIAEAFANRLLNGLRAPLAGRTTSKEET